MVRHPLAHKKNKKEQTRPLFPELAEKEKREETERRIETMRKRLKTQLKLPSKALSVKERTRIMALRINSRAGRMLLLKLQGTLNLERHKMESLTKEAARVKRALEKKHLTEEQAKNFLAFVREFNKFI